MKAPVLLISFISSFAALAALPWSIELAVTPIVVAGLFAILRADYHRRPLATTKVPRGGNGAERLPLAV